MAGLEDVLRRSVGAYAVALVAEVAASSQTNLRRSPSPAGRKVPAFVERVAVRRVVRRRGVVRRGLRPPGADGIERAGLHGIDAQVSAARDGEARVDIDVRAEPDVVHRLGREKVENAV